MPWVWAGRGFVAVPSGLVQLVRPRCPRIDQFLVDTPAPEAPRLELQRVAAQESEAEPMAGSPAAWGFFRVAGSTIRVFIPDDPFAAESALRIAFQVTAGRAGGVLAHGSCVAFRGRAIAALAVSGGGKSTLAELCASRGATVLTDEVVQLFPDGFCAGTPFRSSLLEAGAPVECSVSSLLVLRKGAAEQMRSLEPSAALPPLMQQVFQPIRGLEVSKADLFRRMAGLVERVGVRELTFRKDPAVGDFVQRFLEADARDRIHP